MNNQPPLSEGGLTISWQNWFTQVFNALMGWRQSYTVSQSVTFGSVPAQSQVSRTVAVTNSRPGDSVIVAPIVDVPGIIFTGAVLTSDVVTVYAKNFTTAAVAGGTLTIRVIGLQ